MNERSLGDAPEPETPVDPDDIPVDIDPTTYDVAEFAGGIRPGRRRVTIQPRPDLYPELQRLVEQIETTPEPKSEADTKALDDLIDRFEALQAAMSVEWVLERRSPDWTKAFYLEAANDMGIEAKGGAKDLLRGDFTDEQAAEIGMRCILAQTVSTSDGRDWTLEDMKQLFAAAPEQVDLLSDAVAKVNAGHAEALTLDFSRRRSTSRGTRRTSGS